MVRSPVPLCPATLAWLALLAVVCAPASVLADHDDGLYAQAEGHFSFLSDVADRSILGDTFGYSLRSGFRWGSWSGVVLAEHNMWFTEELERTVRQGALNLGVGAEHLYFGKRVRVLLAVGTSILLSDTALDEPGEVGFFMDVRPTGLRWRVSDTVVLQFDPLTFAVVAPSLEAIPLVLVEYRTVFGVEFDIWNPEHAHD